MTSNPLPPGSFGLPLIGETVQFLRDRDFALKRQAQYGPIFKTQILNRPTVIMVGAEANRFILSTHMEYFSWREGWPDTFKTLLGRSLFLMEGEEHRRNRKLLMPAFHGPALANYFTTMNDTCRRYLDRWVTRGEATMLDELKQMTFAIASTLLLGSEPGDQTAQLSQWFKALSAGLFSVPINLPWTTFGKAIRARDRILAHLEHAIQDRYQTPTTDALGLLVQTTDENGDRLSLDELKAQAILMLFAGHETTTSMLTSLIMALGQNRDLCDRARAEQQTLAAQGPLDLAQLKTMPYLEQVLTEIERLYPPIAGGFRGVVKAFDFNGYHIPAGWQVLYRIDGTHKLADYYPDPNHFDPDRFNPDHPQAKPGDFRLVGFGGGPRVCLGLAFAQMEMKIFAAQLLRHYHWEILPNQDLSLDRIPSLHPRSGLTVRWSTLTTAA
ncbi:cytochrome P450 [Spirulina major]|uniref:cytochrome P450 n=1 Tax=Spirulina major TaxID=270636 RepID=UPI000934400B|nr:cytochrome P450 [Spirulina major]